MTLRCVMPMLMAVLLSACATQGTGRLNTQTIDIAGMPSDCFYVRDIQDWEALTTTNIMVYGGVRTRAYLLTISPPANTIRSSYTIGFENNQRERICGQAGERLIFAGGVGQTYAIMDVRRLDSQAQERLLADKAAFEQQGDRDGQAAQPTATAGEGVQDGD
jgi:hypothetical protein